MDVPTYTAASIIAVPCSDRLKVKILPLSSLTKCLPTKIEM